MKKLFLLLTVLCLTGCGGLPQPREMGDMALLRTIGVDGDGLTVSTGPRAKGVAGEEQPALVLSARADTLSGAARAIQGQSGSYVFFGYVDQLLLGQTDILPVLDWFARDGALSLNAQLWVMENATARAGVESGGEQGVEDRLATLRTDGRLGVGAIPRTAGEVYADLLEQGCAYAPALVLAEGDAGLMAGGYALLDETGVRGFLTGEEAAGLELLAGKPAEDVLTANAGEMPVVVRVYRAVTTPKLASDGTLALTCRLWVRPVEYARPLTREEITQIEARIQAQETARIRAALDRLRREGCDCLGLGSRAGLTAPGRWSALKGDWPETFGTKNPELTVQVELMA